MTVVIMDLHQRVERLREERLRVERSREERLIALHIGVVMGWIWVE